jgi:hypothetical protein
MKDNTNTREAFPLSWPEGYNRTPAENQKRAQFKGTLHTAVNMVNDELRRLGAKNVIISSDVPLRADGLPRSEYKKSIDNGVAVYFEYLKEPTVLACDKWNDVKDNMKAIALTIEAMRGMDRWGVSDMLKRLFLGFTPALPEFTGRPWYEVLGISQDAHETTIKEAYRRLSLKYHPDNQETGERKMFDEIQVAYNQGMKNNGK